ncbi:MAG: bifunctional (p)ppGpp synthetase/guanosine-3',5'-bis(diphosphate) 3'-pyrophosphohydrolase [Clostridiales bacterium]|jgi:GTP pyrophosphokinase|nr:bifunctional (p)ppGpp synthetase/guanosine-3',5'-bis(diphosphate) 3'-pyrophosphohydrolase [Clostridiales bacterium]
MENTEIFQNKVDNLLSKLKRCYPSDYDGLLLGAFNAAYKAHDGQLRESGEPYFIHPMGVADVLIDLGLDVSTIAASLLHDVVEDTYYTQEMIDAEFGAEIGALVKGVTKLDKIVFKSKEEEQAENFRKMFMAMAKDIRVLLIKLADRLHNMRTISSLSSERRHTLAAETLEIYAPLASRLGLSYLKCELEDLCLMVMHPEVYAQLVKDISLKRAERQDIVDNICRLLKSMLDELGIHGEVSGRPKHFYSIYKKMVAQNRTFDQIYDLTAMRVVVETVSDCYEIMGKIHTVWKPIPGRFKDYIAVPKPNNYQSLHTTVMTNYGTPFEIQIRTYEMHKVAEYGIAAHWKYKEKRAESNDLDKKLGWLREVMDMQGEMANPKEFLDSLKIDLYSGQVFVFTPKGDVIILPEGSTPIDFAYTVHSNVGNHCVSAKINSKIVPLATKLKMGDYIEIITASNSKGPSRDWLKLVKTTTARAKIRAFFKKEMKEENIKTGKDMLEAEAKRKGYSLSQLFQPKWLDAVMARLSLTSVDDLYSAVGYGGITTNQVLFKLIDCQKKEEAKDAPPKLEGVQINNRGDNSVIIKGSTGLLVKLARCCAPVPGDEIIGFISRGRGAVVHRQSCSNVKGMEPERLIEAEWANQTQGVIANLKIVAEDKGGLIAKIAGIFSDQKLSIESMNARLDKQHLANIAVSVRVNKTSELEFLFKKLQQMPEVIGVSRT